MKCKTWYSRFRKETSRFLIGHDSNQAPVFYNLIFPIYWLLFLPISYIWIIAVVLNFVVDSLVIWFAARKFRANFAKLWKNVFLKVYLFGWLADFLGVLSWLTFMRLILRGFGLHFMISQYFYPDYLIYALPMVLIAGLLIYRFNRKWAWENSGLTPSGIKMAALWMSIFTMPYTIFIPIEPFL